jgi:hypothetical protein
MSDQPQFDFLRERIAIEELKYRYLRCLDLKDWSGLEACFHPQASAAYADGHFSFRGRDAILDFLRSVLGSTRRLSLHRCHHPEITIHSATRASGRWALDDWIYDLDSATAMQGAAYYEDEYVKEDGRWLILHTGYQRVFEQTWSERDLPSLVRHAPWWEKSSA